MKITFLPGQLELYEEQGEFFVRVKNEVVMRTHRPRAALNHFNTLRKSMEAEFPHQPPTEEELKAILARVLNDSAISETLKRPPKKRSTARSSRTFG